MSRRSSGPKRGRRPEPWSGVYLRSVTLGRTAEDETRFPFSVPIVRSLLTLEFPTPVTFLVGENGSGKSTVLEGLAAATHLPTVGSDSANMDPTLSSARALAERLTLDWSKPTHVGFFLRAEDFFGFVKRVSAMRAEMAREIEGVRAQYAAEQRSAEALTLRLGPLGRSLAELEARYGEDLDAHSHGESFLELFQARFVPGGLYLLDEPEAALSPQSQLALLALMSDMIAQRAQFIVATHSPILLAFPGATIYSCDRVPIAAVTYDQLGSVALLRDFLSGPGRFLHYLLEGR